MSNASLIFRIYQQGESNHVSCAAGQHSLGLAAVLEDLVRLKNGEE